MDDGTQSGPLLRALTSVRLTTVPLFLLCLLFAFTRPKRSEPTSPNPITSVVISTVSPRRALLVTLFSFIAFTYLLDELIVFVYWAARGFRQSYFTQWRGVELADVTGFLAFFTLIIIGSFKDKSGADLWLRKRLKAWLILAIALDIAYLVLLILSVRIFEKRPSSPGIPERPNVPGIYVPNFLHFIALDVRLFLEFVTLIVLFKPSTTYSTARHQAHDAHGRAPEATPSTLLLPASLSTQNNSNQPAYGTFAPPTDAPKSQDAGAGAPPPFKHQGYDLEAQQQQHLAEGSSSHSKDHHTHHVVGDDIVDEPEPLVIRDEPEIEDVPNPVTNDPEALTTSYAAVAAKHADKEAHAADDDAQEVTANISNDVTESPNAFTFPSHNDRDSSSMRNVTFSQDAVGDKSLDTEGGEETTGIDGKKRRRISSQNFKRIVKKISDIPRRQGSISSLGSANRAAAAAGGPGTPGSFNVGSILGEGQTTPKKQQRMSREDSRMSGEGSIGYAAGGSGDSPAPSVDGDSKKGRFRKRLSLSLRKAPTTETKQDST